MSRFAPLIPWSAAAITAALLVGVHPGLDHDPSRPGSAPSGVPERIVLNPTQDPSTSQQVTWRVVDAPAGLDGSIEYREAEDDAQNTDAEITEELGFDAKGHITDDADETVQRATTFTATLTDLDPGTDYEYRVVHGHESSDWHAFTTASADADPFVFTWYADSQKDLAEDWAPIVDLTTQAFPDSALTLQSGDLVNDSFEPLWQEWFDATDGERQAENWLPILGNHEYRNDPGARYWDANFTLPDNGPRADPQAPDAVRPYQEMIAEHLRNRASFIDVQGVRFIQLNSERPDQDDVQEQVGESLPEIDEDEWERIYLDLQRDWLVATLESSTANWHIVQFHHPMFSGAEDRDNPSLRDAWLPVLAEHDVDLVLSGHDHVYARGHLDDDAHGPVFAVSNSGPKYYEVDTQADVWSDNDATRVVAHEGLSITAGVRVTPDSLEYEAIVTRIDDEADTDLRLGDPVDVFTVTRDGAGSTRVTEGLERRVATGLGGSAL